MELLTASSLRSRHGFPTRDGGFSVGAFRGLNTSLGVGDEASTVLRNLALLTGASGAADIVTAKQVHGDRVVGSREVTVVTEADAVWTNETGSAVGVRTADCLPVLLEDRRTGAVAAVHAGWRGVIADIVARAIEAMGAQPSTIFAGIGPCIQKCCFEVDGDLPARFASAFGDEVVCASSAGAKPHLDLPLGVQRTLVRFGVPASHVVALPQCTKCDQRFFSHRRDQGITGRHLSFITCGRASDL